MSTTHPLTLNQLAGRPRAVAPAGIVQAHPALSSTHARPMSAESAERPSPDKALVDIANYIHDHNAFSDLAIETARLCLIDTVGCGLEALRFKHCTNLLGPVVEGTVVPNGM